MGTAADALAANAAATTVNNVPRHWLAAHPITRQAACGYWITTATSKDDLQRGHFWPGVTRTNFPFSSMSAGTLWVQIGQWACPLV